MSCNNKVSISNMTDTWNATGTYKVGVQMDVSDLSSSVNSRLIDLLINSSSKFYVDKYGVINTASTSGWLLNSADHGFGISGNNPSLYVSGSPVLNIGSSSIFPASNRLYDLGSKEYLFRNIYQNTSSTGYPTTNEYPSNYGWGIHKSTSDNKVYLTCNDNGVINTLEFGENSVIGVFDEGFLVNSNITGINFVGSGVTASSIGQLATITLASILTGPTITGNGYTSPFNIPVSADSNNQLFIGTDGRLYANRSFTGVMHGNTLVGDGWSTNLGVRVSTDLSNVLTVGSDGGLFVYSGSGGGGGGFGSGSPVSIRNEGSLLHSSITSIDFVGGGVTATNAGSNITINIPNNTNSTITGNGTNNPLGVGISNNSNNILATGSDGKLYVSNSASQNFANTNLVFNDSRYHTIGNNNLTLATNSGEINLGVLNSEFKGLQITPFSYRLGDDGADNIQLADNSFNIWSPTIKFLSTGLAPKLYLYNNNNTKCVSLSAYTGLSNNLNFILPTNYGVSGNSLSSDGTGNMYWSSVIQSDTNFANTNLALDGSRVHNLGSNSLTLSGVSSIVSIIPASVGNYFAINSNSFTLGTSTGQYIYSDNISNILTNRTNTLALRSVQNNILPKLQLYNHAGNRYVTLSVNSGIQTTYQLFLPLSIGITGQLLTTDGMGYLYWSSGNNNYTDTNFANSDLLLNNSRSHNLNNHTLEIGSGTIIFRPTISGALTLSSAGYFMGFTEKSNLSISEASQKIEIKTKNLNIKSQNNSLSTTPRLSLYSAYNMHYTSLSSSSGLNKNLDFSLPIEYGISGQSLITNGTGGLSWKTIDAVNSVNTGLLTTLQSYYAHSTSSFVPTLSNSFYTGVGVSVDDPDYFHIADSGYLTIHDSGKFLIDFNGAISNIPTGTIISVVKNGSTELARTELQDLGNDDIASFSISCRASLNTNDIITISKSNTGSYFNSLNYRLQQVPTDIGIANYAGFVMVPSSSFGATIDATGTGCYLIPKKILVYPYNEVGSSNQYYASGGYQVDENNPFYVKYGYLGDIQLTTGRSAVGVVVNNILISLDCLDVDWSP